MRAWVMAYFEECCAQECCGAATFWEEARVGLGEGCVGLGEGCVGTAPTV